MPQPERALISRIRKMAQRPGRSRKRSGPIVTGIGDDCAVLRLPAEYDSLVTTDFSLEGIHFRRDWHSPESVGHRCLCRGLSDIAAMGGVPVAVFLSLALPRGLEQAWVDRFLRGLVRLARKYRATVSGGDTAESPNGVLADIVVVGAVPKGEAILRSGARAGDAIYVSGALGGSAAAVSALERQANKKLNPRDYARHFYPEPRIELGRILREKKLATAMIDTSDGLSVDLGHICKASGVGAEVEAEAIRVASVGRPPHEVDFKLALHGGEDYELLFTARPEKRIPVRIAGAQITRIGYIKRRKKVFLINRDGGRSELLPHGWEHFRK